MNSETKTCQNCKNEFRIEPEDFAFYEKIKVPAPTFCPQCRRQRRLAWRNDFYFYSRNCGLCKKPIVSLYSKDKPMPVYCNKCWWSDKWDAKEYGRGFDFSRPFFAQFRELQNKVPTLALVNDDGIASVNCEYTQDFAFGKNCYMTFVAWRVEDCLYSVYLGEVKEIVDSMDVVDNCARVYESIQIGNSYGCRNVYYSSALTHCNFCYDCRDSSRCFLSIGLRHKQYCVKNEQYTKEEYDKIVASYRLDTWSGVRRAETEFLSFIRSYPRRFAYLRNCTNCTGDALINCKNMKDCFNVWRAEDCRYYENGFAPRDSYDVSVGGECSEAYEGLTPDQSYRSLFTIYSWKNTDVTYGENCHSSKYLFGCSGLRNAEYCILNKQYSKEEYVKMKDRIIAHMKKAGEWGEFFPASLSHFGYNETMAQLAYPLRRTDALKEGFKWQEELQMSKGRETLTAGEIAEGIDEISDAITDEILRCTACGRNYRVIPKELAFYRSMRIPIPRECFYCRNERRFRFRNPYFLWHRRCACGGSTSENGVYRNTTNHPSHSTDAHCPNEFETSYASERKEIVYCEQCYQAEVV